MFHETNVLLFLMSYCNGNRVSIEHYFVTILPCLLHVTEIMFHETNILLDVTKIMFLNNIVTINGKQKLSNH